MIEAPDAQDGDEVADGDSEGVDDGASGEGWRRRRQPSPAVAQTSLNFGFPSLSSTFHVMPQ